MLRQRTQQLLQLHNRAARTQLVVDRVPVGVVLAMLAVVKVVLVNGARGVLVNCESRHAG